MPLPADAQARGTVCRGIEIGALIEMPTGILVQGNAGALRTLPQDQTRRAMDPTPRNEAAAALGRLGAGKPKAFSPEDRARRAVLARGLAARTKAARICACGKPVGAGVGDGLCIKCRFAGK
jgi:hypothetical protein